MPAVWTTGFEPGTDPQNVRVFESLLPALTIVALGLLVPAGVVAMVLARGRHASVSSGGDRGGRVAVAAGLAAAAGGTVAWLLGAGLVVALLTALLLAAPVVLWAYLAPWWPVRAVVAWAMLVTGSVAAVGLAAARALESPNPWTALPVAAVGSTAVVLVLERLNGPFRRLLGIRAGIRRAVRTPVFLRPALLRPALAVAVFFAALAAGGLTGVAPRPGDARTPQAGAEPDPGRGTGGGSGTLDADDVRTVSADVTTPSESAGMATGSSAAGASRGAASGGVRGGSATDGAATTAGDRDGAGSSVTATRTASGADSTSGGGTTGGTSGSTTPSGDSGGTGGTDEPVRTVTDTVSSTTETVQKTTETVVDTVEKTADSLTDGGGAATEPVRSVVEPVTSVVEDTTEPVTSVVDSTVDQVTDPLESALP